MRGGGGRTGGFAMAANLVDQGRYEEALPILRCVAKQGEGFEIAQYLAGYSALRLAESPETPDILRAELRVEGFDRMIDAAEAGWPAAQAKLAEEFAATPGTEALEQAAYWAEIYRSNPRERAYGLDRLDDAVEADIETRLDADALDAARVRAAGFTVVPLQAQDIDPACAPYLRQSGAGGDMTRGRGEGQRRPRGGGRGGPGGLTDTADVRAPA